MYSYEHSWAKERMEEALKARVRDCLARELRLAGTVPRMSLVVRGVAFVVALFRG